MGNVYMFPTAQVQGEVSTELSTAVAHLRDTIGVPRDSDAVITRPLFDGYEPYIPPNGAIQLGGQGLADFETRFGDIDDELDPRTLYVGYVALRTGIEARRKVDPEFHDDLLGIARRAQKEKFLFAKVRNVHEVEARLIGYHAARLAAEVQLRRVFPEGRRANRLVALSFAAERRVAVNPAETPDTKKERKRVLSHFSMTVSEDLRGQLEGALRSTVRRQP